MDLNSNRKNHRKNFYLGLKEEKNTAQIITLRERTRGAGTHLAPCRRRRRPKTCAIELPRRRLAGAPPPPCGKERPDAAHTTRRPSERARTAPKGTTKVPLDGAARGSGRTRAPARGATVVPPDIFLRRLRAALRENRKGEGRGHVRAGPLLTGAVEKGEGHGDAAPLRPPWPLPLGAAKKKGGERSK